MIEAFHSNWTAPFLRANPNKNYYIDDFEILTTIISALKWRENNGSIKMITDDIAADYSNSSNSSYVLIAFKPYIRCSKNVI